jgi:hypothetical protein
MRCSRWIVIPARNEAARLAHANEDGRLELVEEPRPIGKGVCVTDADRSVPAGGLIRATRQQLGRGPERRARGRAVDELPHMDDRPVDILLARVAGYGAVATRQSSGGKRPC